nr:MAG TPA: hypothetical protein [Caudoviricetes sp.]DAY04175.1 MAG TPA: hypothetical protein [Caudoviricetes sp.]
MSCIYPKFTILFFLTLQSSKLKVVCRMGIVLECIRIAL